MKRITLWLLATVSVLVLLFGYSTSTSGPSAATSAPPSSYEATTGSSGSSGASGTTGSSGSGSTSGSGSSEASPGTSSGSSSSGSSSSGSSSSGSSSSGSSSGTKTVAGSVAQTQWGPVQVQLTVSGGKVTKVDVLQYPNGNPKDEEINAYALPVLTQETLDAQSASIDMVSGATVTSDGYVQSLQSALDQAGL